MMAVRLRTEGWASCRSSEGLSGRPRSLPAPKPLLTPTLPNPFAA